MNHLRSAPFWHGRRLAMWSVGFACGATALIALALLQTSSNYRIPRNVNDAGGRRATSASYRLISSIGQPIPATRSESTSYRLRSGFLGVPLPFSSADQPNGNCSTAVVITSLPFVDTGEFDSTNDCSGAPNYDVFYKFTPTAAVAYSISLCGGSANQTVRFRISEECCPGGAQYSGGDCINEPGACAVVTLNSGVTYYVECGTQALADTNRYVFKFALFDAPAEMTIQTASPNSVMLRWLPVPCANSYEIHWSTDGETFTSSGITTGETQYLHIIGNDQKRFFRVSALTE